jgi:hypothetical protein
MTKLNPILVGVTAAALIAAGAAAKQIARPCHPSRRRQNRR